MQQLRRCCLPTLLAVLVTISVALLPSAPSRAGALTLSIPQAPSQRQSLGTGLHDAETENRVDRWFHEAMQYIYLGRPSDAMRLAQAMQTVAPEDPRPYLMMARVYRLDVPDQNFERSTLESQLAPIDSVLQISVEKSQQLLDADPNSVAGHLYLGWGLMFQSQLRALADHFWGAGRKAKAGKEHLDRVLELDPENPDARLILGAFLYFADIMPGIAKIASFLVRIPGGDLDRGVELLESACKRWGYGHYDAHSLMGVVQFGFEGDFESARAYFAGVDSTFHYNARMQEPIAIIDLFLPSNLAANLPHLEKTVLIHEQSPEPWIRKATARLRFYLGMSQLLTGRFDAAQASLEMLVEDLPADPDWFERSVRLMLADVLLLRGDARGAQRVQASASTRELRQRLAYVYEDGAAASPIAWQRLETLQPWIRALYDGRYAEVADGLSHWGEDPLALFYRAELELLRERPEAAIEPLQRFLAYDTPPRYRFYRYLTMLRLAEAYGRSGNRTRAEEILGDAIDFHEDRDLMRHVTKARRRWYEDSDRPG
jgi:tetratricopeptide (TPR) repeat protein